MKDLNYTNVKEQEYESISDNINIIGDILEQWIYENVYPSEINWGELDMDSSDVVVVEMTLRFDRAYFIKQ